MGGIFHHLLIYEVLRVCANKGENMNKRILLLSCCYMYASLASAYAAENNMSELSYTHFGLGIEAVTYQERMSVGAGELRLKTTVNNVIQRSGGYTPISSKAGFIIGTVSSIDSGNSTENWNLGNLGTVQTDNMRVEMTEVNLEGVRVYKPGHFFSGGLGVRNLKFTRSNFNTSTAIRDTPLGAIAESNMNVVATVGYRYDSFFIEPERTIRTAFMVQAGIPVYYDVENTGGAMHNRLSGNQNVNIAVYRQAPVSIVKYFPSGYDIKLNGLLGYKINNRFTVTSFNELAYTKRSSMTKANATVPEVTVLALRSTLSMLWTF